MTAHQREIEHANPPREGNGKNGPGLAGAQEGIERSGPPMGMAGGDTSLHSQPARQPTYPDLHDPERATSSHSSGRNN